MCRKNTYELTTCDSEIGMIEELLRYSREEITMSSCTESIRHGKATRCAVCDGKFGLIRHYSWRTPLCSKKCVDRFRTRRESDRNWLPWLQVAVDQLQANRARAL